MPIKGINIKANFQLDTTAARQQLMGLQQQLNGLTAKNSVNLGVGTEITKAVKDAELLKQTLREAFNVNTGSFDLTKFNQQITQAGKTIGDFKNSLATLGTDGEKAFNGLATTIMSAQMPVQRMSTGLQKLTTAFGNTMYWQATSMAMHKVVGTFQEAFNYAKNLDRSLNSIQIVTGHTSDYMRNFAKQANEAAKALSASTLEYTNASLIYYQQGLSDKEVQKRTETTLKLAKVTGESAGKVSQQMTAVWNNFSNGVDNLERYADVMTALGATTASSSSEIAKGLEKFASVSKTIGLSYDYAASALATITAQTRQSADSVGTGLKTLFSRLESLNLGETLDDDVTLNKYSKALATVGVNVLDATGKLRDMDTILDDLGGKWKNLTSAQQVALAQTVGGVRNYTSLITLMDNWDDFQTNLATSQMAEGTLQKQANIYADSWEAAQQRVKTAAQGIYDSLISSDFFKGLNNLTAGLLNGINKVTSTLGSGGTLAGLANLYSFINPEKTSQMLENGFINVFGRTSIGQNYFNNQKVALINDLTKDLTNGLPFSEPRNKAISQLKEDWSNFSTKGLSKAEAQAQLNIMNARTATLQSIMDESINLREQSKSVYLAQQRAASTLTRLGINNNTVNQILKPMGTGLDMQTQGLGMGQFLSDRFTNLALSLASSSTPDAYTGNEELFNNLVKNLYNGDTESLFASVAKNGIYANNENLQKITELFDQVRSGTSLTPAQYQQLAQHITQLTIADDKTIEEMGANARKEALAAFDKQNNIKTDARGRLVNASGRPISEELKRERNETADKAEKQAVKGGQTGQGYGTGQFTNDSKSRDAAQKDGNVFKYQANAGKDQTATMGQGLMQTGQMFNSIAMATSSISNFNKSLKDGTASVTGFASVLGSVGMAGATTISTLFNDTKIGGSALTVGKLGLYGLAAAAALGAGYMGYKYITRDSDKNLATRAQEDSIQLKSTAKEEQTKYEQFLGVMESYQKEVIKLQSLQTTTSAYTSQLISNNNTAQEIIDTYHLKAGQDYTYEAGKGFIFTPSQISKINQTLEERANETSAMATLGSIVSSQLSAQTTQKNETESVRLEKSTKMMVKPSTNSQAHGPSAARSRRELGIQPLPSSTTTDMYGPSAAKARRGAIEYYLSDEDQEYFDTELQQIKDNYYNTTKANLEVALNAVLQSIDFTSDDFKDIGKDAATLAIYQMGEDPDFIKSFAEKAGEAFAIKDTEGKSVSIRKEFGGLAEEGDLRKAYNIVMGYNAADGMSREAMAAEIEVKQFTDWIQKQIQSEGSKFTEVSEYVSKFANLNTLDYKGLQSLSSEIAIKASQDSNYKVYDTFIGQGFKTFGTKITDLLISLNNNSLFQGSTLTDITHQLLDVNNLMPQEIDLLNSYFNNYNRVFGEETGKWIYNNLLNVGEDSTGLDKNVLKILETIDTENSITGLAAIQRQENLYALSNNELSNTVKDLRKTILEDINDRGSLAKELFNSSDFQSVLTSFQDILLSTGHISAETMAKAASKNETLSSYLSLTNNNYAALEDLIAAVSSGDITTAQLAEPYVTATETASDSENLQQIGLDTLANQDLPESYSDMAKYYQNIGKAFINAKSANMLMDQSLIAGLEMMLSSNDLNKYKTIVGKGGTTSEILSRIESEMPDFYKAITTFGGTGKQYGKGGGSLNDAFIMWSQLGYLPTGVSVDSNGQVNDTGLWDAIKAAYYSNDKNFDGLREVLTQQDFDNSNALTSKAVQAYFEGSLKNKGIFSDQQVEVFTAQIMGYFASTSQGMYLQSNDLIKATNDWLKVIQDSGFYDTDTMKAFYEANKSVFDLMKEIDPDAFKSIFDEQANTWENFQNYITQQAQNAIAFSFSEAKDAKTANEFFKALGEDVTAENFDKVLQSMGIKSKDLVGLNGKVFTAQNYDEVITLMQEQLGLNNTLLNDILTEAGYFKDGDNSQQLYYRVGSKLFGNEGYISRADFKDLSSFQNEITRATQSDWVIQTLLSAQIGTIADKIGTTVNGREYTFQDAVEEAMNATATAQSSSYIPSKNAVIYQEDNSSYEIDEEGNITLRQGGKTSAEWQDIYDQAVKEKNTQLQQQAKAALAYIAPFEAQQNYDQTISQRDQAFRNWQSNLFEQNILAQKNVGLQKALEILESFETEQASRREAVVEKKEEQRKAKDDFETASGAEIRYREDIFNPLEQEYNALAIKDNDTLVEIADIMGGGLEGVESLFGTSDTEGLYDKKTSIETKRAEYEKRLSEIAAEKGIIDSELETTTEKMDGITEYLDNKMTEEVSYITDTGSSDIDIIRERTDELLEEKGISHADIQQAAEELMATSSTLQWTEAWEQARQAAIAPYQDEFNQDEIISQAAAHTAALAAGAKESQRPVEIQRQIDNLAQGYMQEFGMGLEEATNQAWTELFGEQAGIVRNQTEAALTAMTDSELTYRELDQAKIDLEKNKAELDGEEAEIYRALDALSEEEAQIDAGIEIAEHQVSTASQQAGVEVTGNISDSNAEELTEAFKNQMEDAEAALTTITEYGVARGHMATLTQATEAAQGVVSAADLEVDEAVNDLRNSAITFFEDYPGLKDKTAAGLKESIEANNETLVELAETGRDLYTEYQGQEEAVVIADQERAEILSNNPDVAKELGNTNTTNSTNNVDLPATGNATGGDGTAGTGTGSGRQGVISANTALQSRDYVGAASALNEATGGALGETGSWHWQRMMELNPGKSVEDLIEMIETNPYSEQWQKDLVAQVKRANTSLDDVVKYGEMTATNTEFTKAEADRQVEAGNMTKNQDGTYKDNKTGETYKFEEGKTYKQNSNGEWEESKGPNSSSQSAEDRVKAAFGDQGVPANSSGTVVLGDVVVNWTSDENGNVHVGQPAASGQNNARILNYAQGKNTPHIAITGELGPELHIKENGDTELLGKKGREYAFVGPNDRIYTANQTRKILNNRHTEDLNMLARGINNILPGYAKSLGADQIGGKGSGGNDKSGGNSSKKDDKDPRYDNSIKLRELLERYYTILQQLDNIVKQLERIGKAVERSWGVERVRAIEKQTELLQKQFDAQKEYVHQIEEYLTTDKEAASLSIQEFIDEWNEKADKNKQLERIDIVGGLRYDDDGVITNYREVVEKMVETFNIAMEKHQLKGTDQKKFEERLKDIQFYTDTLNLYEEQTSALEDLRNQILDSQIREITYKVEYEIELDNDILKILNFDYSLVQNNMFKVAEAIDIMGKKADESTKKMETYKNAIHDLLAIYVPGNERHSTSELGIEIDGSGNIIGGNDSEARLNKWLDQLAENKSDVVKKIREAIERDEEGNITNYEDIVKQTIIGGSDIIGDENMDAQIENWINELETKDKKVAKKLRREIEKKKKKDENYGNNEIIQDIIAAYDGIEDAPDIMAQIDAWVEEALKNENYNDKINEWINKLALFDSKSAELIKSHLEYNEKGDIVNYGEIVDELNEANIHLEEHMQDLMMNDPEAFYAEMLQNIKNTDLRDIDASIIEQLNGYVDQIQNEMLQNQLGTYTSQLALIGDTVKNFNKKVSTHMDEFGYYEGVYRSFIDIIDLTNRELTGVNAEFFKTMNNASFDNALNKLKASNTQYKLFGNTLQQVQNEYNHLIQLRQQEIANGTMTADRQKYFDIAIQAAEEELQQANTTFEEAHKDFLEAWKDTLNKTMEIYKDTVEQASKDFEKSFSPLFSTLELLQDQFAREKELGDLYADNYQRIYDLSKLNRDIEQSILDTDNLKGKQRLRDLQEEINQLQEDGTELSEYDLDILDKKYKLELARQALEDAKDAKSLVRLSRDNNGNWGYVYTADETDVAEAEQAYEDAIRDMEQANEDYIDNLQNEILSVQQKAQQAIQKLSPDEFSTYDEYLAAINRIINGTNQTLATYQSQLDNALANNQYLDPFIRDRYNGENSHGLTDDFANTILSGLLVNNNLGSVVDDANKRLTDFANTMLEAYIKYSEGQELVYATIGKEVGSVVDDFLGETGEIAEASDETVDTVEELANKMENSFTEAINAMAKSTDKFFENLNQKMIYMENLIENLLRIKYLSGESVLPYQLGLWSKVDTEQEINDIRKALKEYGIIDVIDENGESIQLITGTRHAEEFLQQAQDEILKRQAMDMGKEINSKEELQEIKDAFEALGDDEYLYVKLGDELIKLIKGTEEAEEQLKEWEEAIKKGLVTPGCDGHWHDIMLGGECYRGGSSSTSDTGGYTGRWQSADTGMYTGEWAGGSVRRNGRWALLHQKELVLNAHDTENFLDAMQIVRQLDNLTNWMANGLGDIMSPHVDAPTGTLEQDVTIHAEFPNATDHTEIEMAFNDLVNLASQYANRK